MSNEIGGGAKANEEMDGNGEVIRKE